MSDIDIHVESLPNEEAGTYGVMITRLYCDRIRNALTSNGGESTWSTLRVCLDDEQETVNPPEKKLRYNESERTDKFKVNVNGNVQEGNQWSVVPTQLEKGGRKERTGYNLFIVKNTTVSPADLPPMARRNISWVKSLTHRVFIRSQEAEAEVTQQAEIYTNLMDSLANALYNNLCKMIEDEEIDLFETPIRVDTFPKSIAEGVCRSLQRHAHARASINTNNDQYQPHSTIDDTDAFTGPLHLTKSQSRAAYTISIIESTPQKEYMFGIQTKDENWSKMNSRMNDNDSAKEVLIQAADPMGKDLQKCESHAPVSRAYYKLKQVFQDQRSFLEDCVAAGGSGLDLGSSPGGWVQNLHENGLTRILSIDPGILAERVEKLDGVKHFRKDFTSNESIEEMASFAPFSVCVCDASADASEVFSKVVSTFEKVSESLQNGNRRLLTIPSTVVVTVKCPYKTAGSLERMLGKIYEDLPNVIQSILQSMKVDSSEVTAKYTMLHLMANSGSERTVVIRFQNA